MSCLFTRYVIPRMRLSASTYRRSLPLRNSRSFSKTKDALALDYDLVDPSVLIEEETISGYVAKHYYPVSIGNLFRERYKVIAKLGYGSASTVWLCHDLRKEQDYVALKVYINSSKVHREVPIYDHINSLNSQHGGRHHVRQMLDSFEITGPDGKHTCLVHEALGMNMDELRELVPEEMFAPDLVRQTLRDILRAMHFLHEEAHVIHTDIQPKNILLGILDNSAFARFEQYEREQPMPRKQLPSRTIYASRMMPLTKGAPSLCDLSEARFDGPDNIDRVMPDVYRAPEVLLGMPWSYPVDVWAFATTVCVDAAGGDGCYSEQHHLAQMISLMGAPPLDFLERSEKSHLYWDSEDRLLGHAGSVAATDNLSHHRTHGRNIRPAPCNASVGSNLLQCYSAFASQSWCQQLRQATRPWLRRPPENGSRLISAIYHGGCDSRIVGGNEQVLAFQKFVDGLPAGSGSREGKVPRPRLRSGPVPPIPTSPPTKRMRHAVYVSPRRELAHVDWGKMSWKST
nr:serine/threonine-protein kinase srpk [Quercus suber]